MTGSVQRRNGKWQYRFDRGPDPLTGRRRQTAVGGFATRREAERALREALHADEQGRYVKRSRRTVADYLDEWHRTIRPSVRPSTWVNYRDYRDAYVVPLIGDTALQDLTPVRLNLLYAHLLEQGRKRRTGQDPKVTRMRASKRTATTQKPPAGLAPKTVANVHRMLHRALRDAVRWGYLDVAEDAQAPRVPRRRLDVWTPEQLRAFVHHVRDDDLFALWLVLVTTGVRRGELIGLRRSDVDLERGRVSPSAPRVVVDGEAADSETKTDAGRRVMSLDPVTTAALRAHVEAWERRRSEFGFDTDLLFCWPDGRPIHPQTITEWFKDHVRAARLPPIRLHDVRHSYATAALLAGVHPKIVSERLGHASAAFTLATYTHVLEGMDRAGAEAVADLILGPSATQDEGHVHEFVHVACPTPLDSEEVKGQSPGHDW